MLEALQGHEAGAGPKKMLGSRHGFWVVLRQKWRQKPESLDEKIGKYRSNSLVLDVDKLEERWICHILTYCQKT
jgi:hypothetical protein